MKINNKLGNNAETIKSTLHFFMCKHFFDETFLGESVNFDIITSLH